jgi:hypothetical protein
MLFNLPQVSFLTKLKTIISIYANIVKIAQIGNLHGLLFVKEDKGKEDYRSKKTVFFVSVPGFFPVFVGLISDVKSRKADQAFPGNRATQEAKFPFFIKYVKSTIPRSNRSSKLWNRWTT